MNFNTKVYGDVNQWFIMFYAPWSDECKELLPIFADLSTKYTDIQFGQIDITVETQVYNQFKIEKFPKLYLIRKTDGKLKDMVLYGSDFTSTEIENWLETYLEIKQKPQSQK